MNQSFSPFQPSQPGWASPAQSRGATYTHPDDVTSDPKLTTAEKRAVLASWISDVRAVEDAPSFRRLDSGAVVEVDAIVVARHVMQNHRDGHRMVEIVAIVLLGAGFAR